MTSCRFDLDMLLEAVEEHRSIPGSPLYQCLLGNDTIGQDSSIVVHRSFENGVVKVQRGEIETLTRAERRSITCLPKPNASEDDVTVPAEESSSTMSMAERLSKRRKKETDTNKYMDCSFILGSVAEVERAWSVAKYVLPDHRLSMAP